jgi:hypothetical protein
LPLTLGSTCVVIEERPEDIPYSEESNAQAMEEEEVETLDSRANR